MYSTTFGHLRLGFGGERNWKKGNNRPQIDADGRRSNQTCLPAFIGVHLRPTTELEKMMSASSRFVYVTYIRTTPATLWQALIDSEFTRQYWMETWQIVRGRLGRRGSS